MSARDFPEDFPVARSNVGTGAVSSVAPPAIEPVPMSSSTDVIARPNFTTPGARQPYDFDAETPSLREKPPQLGYAPAAPGVAEDASFLGKIKSAGHAIGDTIGRYAGRAAGVAGVGLGAYEAASGVREGDYGKAALGAADAVAGAGLATGYGTLPAGAYLGARALTAGTPLGTTDDIMPNTRNVLRGANEDAQPLVNSGQYGAAAGHYARGAAALVPALAHDVLDGPANFLANKVGGRPDMSAGDAAAALGQHLANGARTFAGLPPVPVAGGAAPARQGTAYPAGNSTAGGGRGSINPPMASATGDARPDLAGIPSLNGGTGTAVDGAAGVRKFTTADGRTLYSNVAGGDNDKLMSGKPGIQTVPGLGGGAGGAGGAGSSGLRDVAALSADNRALGGDPNALFTTPGLAYGGSGKTIFDSNKEGAESQNLGPSLAEARSLSGRQRRQFDLEERGQNKQMDIARMNNETQRDSTNRTVGATLRGQDLTHESSMLGHQITGANARARLGYDMRKDARDFGQKREEFEAGRSDKGYEQQRQSEEQLQKNLEARFTTKDDKGNVVPDHAKVADYRAAINTTLPAMISELEQAGTPKTLAKAADLRKRGPAALEPGDHEDLQQLYDTGNRMVQARGIGPNQATAIRSKNLLDYRQLPGAKGVEHRVFGGNRVNTKAGSVSLNDLAYEDGPANAILPDMPWKQRTNNLTRGIRTE